MNLALLYLYGVGASTLGGALVVLFVVNGSIMLVFSHSAFRVEYSHIHGLLVDGSISLGRLTSILLVDGSINVRVPDSF